MRYHFHLRVGRELSPDDVGLDLPDLDAAYLEAFHAAQGMWTELLAERSDPLARSFEITDPEGRLLLVLPFREVLDTARNPGAPLNQVVKLAAALLDHTRSLADSLRAQIEATHRTIESTHETIEKTQRVLDGIAGGKSDPL